MPHILFAVRWPVGGIRTYLRDVCRNLAMRGYRISIVTVDMIEVDELKHALGSAVKDWHLLGKPHSAWTLMRRIAGLHQLEKYDLVHAQGYTAGFCALVPSLLASVPVCLTSHDMLFRKQFQGIGGHARRFLMSRLFGGFREINLISQDAASNFAEMFPRRRPRRICVIRNGVDAETLRRGLPRDYRHDLNLPANAFLVGFFGRFMAPKGFGVLIDAVSTLVSKLGATCRLCVLCVGGAGGFDREERLRIDELGIGEWFRFLPFDPEVGRAIRGMDLVAIPSRWETCPLLPMEALVCGVPVAASTCIGLREVIDGTPVYKFPPNDSSALYEILEAAMNQGLAEAEFAKFAAQAAETFSIEKTVQEICDLYGRATAKGKRFL